MKMKQEKLRLQYLYILKIDESCRVPLKAALIKEEPRCQILSRSFPMTTNHRAFCDVT